MGLWKMTATDDKKGETVPSEKKGKKKKVHPGMRSVPVTERKLRLAEVWVSPIPAHCQPLSLSAKAHRDVG